jgi:hypothetical protein
MGDVQEAKVSMSVGSLSWGMYWPNISKCRVAAFNGSRRRDKVLELSFLVGGIRDIVGL